MPGVAQFDSNAHSDAVELIQDSTEPPLKGDLVDGVRGNFSGERELLPGRNERWRQLEGGRLAEERPPAPRADDPYPNLGSVPARPATTAAATRAGIAAALAADQRDGAFAVTQPIAPMVEATVDILMDQIASGEMEPQHRLIAGELIVRTSARLPRTGIVERDGIKIFKPAGGL